MIKRKPLSDEHKKKLSIAHTGKKLSEDHKKKLSTIRLGIIHSDETKKRMSISAIRCGSGRWMKGRKLSEETRKKMSQGQKGRVAAMKGKKYPVEHRIRLSLNRPKGKMAYQWKGGVTPINEKIRKSLEYKLWREAVFRRDNWTCVLGGKEHGSKLNADHIKPFAHYPELRLAINNGRTLCVSCHRKTDTWGSKSSKS